MHRRQILKLLGGSAVGVGVPGAVVGVGNAAPVYYGYS